MKILSNINSPKDVKKLNLQDLETLALEVRNAILNRTSIIGGHVAPNLGIVEATIALHYVFNSPIDKFVFDVSHQCYVHKLLTGRIEALRSIRQFGGISGIASLVEIAYRTNAQDLVPTTMFLEYFQHLFLFDDFF